MAASRQGLTPAEKERRARNAAQYVQSLKAKQQASNQPKKATPAKKKEAAKVAQAAKNEIKTQRREERLAGQPAAPAPAAAPKPAGKPAGNKKGTPSVGKMARQTTKKDNKFGRKDYTRLRRKHDLNKGDLRQVAEKAESRGSRIGKWVRDKLAQKAGKKKGNQATAPQTATPGQAYADAPSAPDAGAIHGSGQFGATGSDGFIKTHWGNSPEVSLDYANNMARYNRDNISYLEQVGRASQSGQAGMLNSIAKRIPKYKQESEEGSSIQDIFETVRRGLTEAPEE